MKLRRLPEDFRVEELSRFSPDGGPFAVYHLQKRSLGTPEAIQAVCRRWKIPRRNVSYGGLKDRHAVTRQTLTIRKGPRRDLEQENQRLSYVGQASRPFTPHDIDANRFEIVVRDLSGPEAAAVQSAVPLVARDGVPDYFDDQRFGSLGESREYIAQPWCAGNYERALWLAIAEPNPHDRPDDRREKQILRDRWGDWPACRSELSRSSRRSIVTFLADHPHDFRRAFALLRADLRGLYLSAFQSAVWNDILQRRLRQEFSGSQLIEAELESGPVAFFRELTDSQRTQLHGLLLPLPSARLHFEPDDELKPLYDEALAARGMELREMRVKHPRDSFFSRGDRAAVVCPTDLRAAEAADEQYSGRRQITLTFTLPRGAYATIVIKRLLMT